MGEVKLTPKFRNIYRTGEAQRAQAEREGRDAAERISAAIYQPNRRAALSHTQAKGDE